MNQSKQQAFNETHTSLVGKIKVVKGVQKTEKHVQQQIIQCPIENGRQARFHFQRALSFDYCLLVFLQTIQLFLLFTTIQIKKAKSQSLASYCMHCQCCQSPRVNKIKFSRDNNLPIFCSNKAGKKVKKILDKQQTLLSSGKALNMAVQILLLLPQPYPFLNSITFTTIDIYDNFNFEFKLNYLLVLFGFIKIFIVIRVLLRRQIYMSPRSSRLCRMYGCQSDYLYAIKCLFKDSPISLIGIVFAVSVLLFALCLRISQESINEYYPLFFNGQKNPMNLSKFQNSLWLTIITMTTVGYGDFFPKTLIGRLITVLLVIWGTFIVSLMVVVLTNTLNMDQSEKRALIVLNRLEAKKSLKDAAAYLITHSCKKYLIRKQIARGNKPPLTDEQTQKLQNSFYKYLTNFQKVHRVIRSMYQMDDLYEQMTRQFQFINDQINCLITSQEETISNLKNYINNQDEDKNKQVKND